MQDLLSSASKLVFILIAVAASTGFFLGLLSEDNFMILATGAFAFFFSYKGTEGAEYAGK